MCSIEQCIVQYCSAPKISWSSITCYCILYSLLLVLLYISVLSLFHSPLYMYICLSSGICPCLCLNIFYIFFIPVSISFVLSLFLTIFCLRYYSLLVKFLFHLLPLICPIPYSNYVFIFLSLFLPILLSFLALLLSLFCLCLYLSLLPYSVLFCFYSLSIHATAFCPFNLFLMGVQRSSVGVRRSSLGVRCSSVVSTLDC